MRIDDTYRVTIPKEQDMAGLLDKSSRTGARKKNVTMSISVEVIEEAKAHGLNVSAVSEEALRRAGAEARRAAWLDENREALAEHDAWIEEHGLPLEDERLF